MFSFFFIPFVLLSYYCTIHSNSQKFKLTTSSILCEESKKKTFYHPPFKLKRQVLGGAPLWLICFCKAALLVAAEDSGTSFLFKETGK